MRRRTRIKKRKRERESESMEGKLESGSVPGDREAFVRTVSPVQRQALSSMIYAVSGKLDPTSHPATRSINLSCPCQ